MMMRWMGYFREMTQGNGMNQTQGKGMKPTTRGRGRGKGTW